MINIQEPENLKIYAHIVDNKVVNVSVWNGIAPYTPDETLVEIPEGSFAGIGWDYIDKNFEDKRPKPPEFPDPK
jgi:hypothetical protein